jgi:hypothetical protein
LQPPHRPRRSPLTGAPMALAPLKASNQHQNTIAEANVGPGRDGGFCQHEFGMLAQLAGSWAARSARSIPSFKSGGSGSTAPAVLAPPPRRQAAAGCLRSGFGSRGGNTRVRRGEGGGLLQRVRQKLWPRQPGRRSNRLLLWRQTAAWAARWPALGVGRAGEALGCPMGGHRGWEGPGLPDGRPSGLGGP